jgi:hypothetical protein
MMAEPLPPPKPGETSSRPTGLTASSATPPAPPANRGQEPSMICRNLTKGNLVASQLSLATTPETRRQGLLGRSSLAADEGMLIDSCGWVHTVGMKFPIDIVFLDRRAQVVRILRSVAPGQTPGPCLTARSTLELAAGAAALKRIEVGDRLLIARSTEASPKGK